jgi:serine/threonine protein kinase/tetratricopeptide (TPR) repeat protein
VQIDSKDWAEFSPVLDRMLELPAEEREAWAQGLTGADALWSPRLLRLLRAAKNSRATGWFDTLPRFTDLSGADPADLPGDDLDSVGESSEIGPYRLVRLLGRGGMGSVWYAERSDGLVRRGIALKLPQGLFGDEHMAARFAREREIIASLAHPHIAPLYDAGISADGQPYLALEYVEGKPLDEYCDRHRLDVRARIELFRQVLDAVQYAHSRLVIHRDLKPSNILVTEGGRVRLLDFGVAKLLGTEAGDKTELTRFAGAAMTLSYASPEQVAGEPVATTADIYSLGVLLFELLVGARPYRVPRDTRGALEEAILRADIPLPSAVVGEDAAATRSTSTFKLRRDLRGDLDAILLKMLNRQPRLRYATAAAVSEDLARYADGEAVQAHRPSRWYWLRKFVARNRLVVASAALASAALLAGAGLALWQAREAQQQARLANAERDRELAAAEHREAVDEFMSDLLLEAGRTGKPVSVTNLIARADALSSQEFIDNAEARAAVLATVGRFALDVDGIDKALPYFDRAQGLVAHSQDAELRAHIVCTRAKMRGILGHAEEAERAFKSILEDPQSSPAARSECYGDEARLAVVRYDAPAALRATQQGLAQWQASSGRSPEQRLELLTYQAEAQALDGKPNEAEQGYAYVLKELKRLGRERNELSEEVLADRFNASLRSGDFKLAFDQAVDAIAILNEDFPDRPPPAVWLYQRSMVLAYLGQYQQAVDGFQSVARTASEDRLSRQRAELDTAAALSKLGRAEEAERHYRTAIDIANSGSPGQVPLSDIANLLTRAKLDLDERHYPAARDTLSQVLKAPAVGATSLSTAHRLRAIAELGAGDLDPALEDAKTAVGMSERQRGDKPYSAWLGQAKLVLGQVLQAKGQAPDAQAAYSEAVAQLTMSVGTDHPALRQARALLAQLPGSGSQKD